MTLKYRREIDGLRAIAVLAVVLYHAEFSFLNFNLFKGGYIGVDIFFVISGYLISSIIISDINDGNFSFSNFYERRARRILPPLFIVMAVSIPFAWVKMSPKAMEEYAGSILSSLAFSSNLWFWKEDSYWAEPSALKPFLHTWSLSVEEQFYLLFPVLLLVLVKFARNRINLYFFAVFIVSLLSAHFFSLGYAEASFYLLPTRAWEILAGAMLAINEMNKSRITHRLLDVTMPAFGLLLIFTSIAVFENGTRHPSFITLLPVMGTMIMIMFCKPGELVSDLLGSKPLVGIGLISYGFYLWHYPIFAFAKINDFSSTGISKFQLIMLSLALSFVTYFLVEKPVRNRSKLKLRTFVPLVLCSLIALVVTQTVFYKTNGAEFRMSRFSELVEMNYWSEGGGNREKFSTYNGCWLSEENFVKNDPFQTCKSGELSNNKRKIAVVGDSNIGSIIPGLISIFGRETVLERVVNGCFPARTYRDEFCKNAMSVAISDAVKSDPDLIILGGHYSQFNFNPNISGLEDLLNNELKLYREKTIIFGPLPRWGDLPKRLNVMYEQDPISFVVPDRLPPLLYTFQIDDAAQKMAENMGVAYLSPVKTFCLDMSCLVKTGNNSDDITSYDSEHLTHNASTYLIEKNMNLIKKYISIQN